MPTNRRRGGGGFGGRHGISRGPNPTPNGSQENPVRADKQSAVRETEVSDANRLIEKANRFLARGTCRDQEIV